MAWQSLDGAGVVGAFVEQEGGVRSLGVLSTYPFYLTDLASNGSTALLLLSGGDPKFTLTAIWLDSDAREIARKEFADNAFTSLAAWNGNEFIIVWRRLNCGVYLCEASFYQVTASSVGALGSPRLIYEVKEANTFDRDVLGLSATRERTFLVFAELASITGVVISRNGAPVTATSVIEAEGAGGSPVGIANDGESFLLIYSHVEGFVPQRTATTRARRVTAAGEISPSQTLVADVSQFAIAWTGQSCLSANSLPRGQTHKIFSRALSSSGQPASDESLLSRAPNQQEAPSAAFDGRTLLVAWEEFDAGAGRWKVMFGAPDAAARGTPVADSENDQRNPKVVFDGSRFTVFWTDHRPGLTSTIYGRRGNDSPFEVTRTACPTPFDAVALSGRIAMAYSDCSRVHAGAPRDLVVSSIHSSGAISTPVLVASPAPERPAIAGSGSDALIVWGAAAQRTADEPCPLGYEYCLPKLILRGALLSDGGVRTIDIPTDGFLNQNPQVAWNGSHYLVAWAGSPEINVSAAFKGRLLSASGEAASPIIQISKSSKWIPYSRLKGVVAWNGVNFVAAWQPGSADDKLALSAIDARGNLLTEMENVIESGSLNLQQLALTPGLRGTAYLTYSVAGPESEYLGHNRVVWRAITEGAARRRLVGR